MRLLPLLCLLALALPAAASASTVTVRPNPDRVEPGHPDNGLIDEVYYAAAPGEANDVLVAYGGDYRTVTVTDPGATITASESCESIDEHTAHCVKRERRTNTRVELGDMDDEVATTHPGGSSSYAGVNAFGGPGDDLLDGGWGSDELDGGGGTDTLLGGDSSDTLTDGDTSGNVNRDVLNGGTGAADRVSYASRTGGVTVDLGGEGPFGEAGENDHVEQFERVTGGEGDDRLTGDESPNDLVGLSGDDVLIGRGGDDLFHFGDGLDGGEGNDRIDGGDGPDRITGGPGTDDPSCGSGGDTVYDPKAGELLGRSCEQIYYAFGEFREDILSFAPYPVKVSRRAATFRLECPKYEERDGEPSACKGPVTLREAEGRHRLLGRATLANPKLKDALDVRVKLTKLGRRLAHRSSGVDVTVRLSGDKLPKVAWTIRLRA